jgi:hypothetical protein
MDEDAPRTNLRKPIRTAWIALAAAVLAVLGGLWWLGRPAGPAAPGVAASAPPATPAAGAAAAAASAPAPEVSDPEARGLLGGVCAHPLCLRFLSQPDLVRRLAAVTDNIARGESPRRPLEPLAPEKPFAVEDQRGRAVIAGASYARYDPVADAVGSVDAHALAAAYRTLHPALEGAYRALGYPGASLDRAVALALRRIGAAPVREGDVAVVPKGGVYAFADPALEKLGPVEKQLLRMGPRNTRLVQRKVAELRAALALPEPAPEPVADAPR